ncbi:amino acid adenylation domain-containing protein [Chryseobacterium nematophagum]|uniref:Amino acid adenylation domain-containing protein n=1 Tax=Chryseobacterium nematophagum TaxID=2305228 RepID=A0A3M7LDX8_9FLAO|nr:non-ribosomal peptide synthetase [Chryseobacterium nematophagum]RMZ60264.1 amino acid adenylation domain-containing protein [Chryseobacterium nematophagum]
MYGEVLGLEPSSISIHDDFFRLGGNSIMAIKLISRIHRDLGFAVTVAMLFTHKNIYSLSHVLESSDNVMSNSMIGAITVSDVEDQKLSFAQERLWFLDQYEGGSSAYNIPMVFGLSGTTDLGILKSSFSHLLSRHDILRTLILKDSEGQGYQYVSDKMLCINETVVSSVSELDLELEKEMGRVFLLSEELPISVRLFSLEDNFYLTVVIHHIAFDGWSIDIFFRELSIIYESLLLGIEPDLRPLSISYKDFALWQRDYLSGSVLSVQLDYWKTHLNGFEPLNLPLDYARPSVVSYVGKSLSCSFSPELSTHLRSLSKDLGISLYSVMLGGYYLLLSSYSGQRDIILGTPVANRHHSGLEDLIGFFVNTLVLRAELDFNLDISDYLVHISSLVSSAQIHQDVPFEKLVDELGLDHDASRHPVFQVMFGLESFGSESKTYYGLDSFLLPYEGSLHYDVAKFDLTTMIDDSGDSLLCSFTYSTALFRESTVKEMMSTYVYLLEQLVSFRSSSLSGIKISDLAFVGEASGLSFLKDVNGCYVDYVSDTTLQELFERQVERTPDDIALVYEDVKLTYRELNDRSNQLAHYLLENFEIKSDELIPLCLERSEQMLIGILGVLKSGGAYVPMDPGYPMDRIEHILKDTNARVVIGEESTKNRLYDYKELIDREESSSLNIISLNALNIVDSLSTCSTDNPLPSVSSSDLAYVIYTSGTTGKPKGVMIEHRSVVNLVESIRGVYDYSERGKFTAYTSYVFDVSVSEIFSALLYGNELHLLSDTIRKDSSSISDYLLAQEITHTYLPPVLLSLLPRNVYPYLQAILYAGEPCDEETGIYWGEHKKLYNLYGPTESTIYATCKEIVEGEVHVIGKPIVNTTTYVLDEYLRHVPLGGVGELYIGGVGVSRGYLNLAELTDERFVVNPFQREDEKEIGYNSRIYKTGDLVRFLPDGNLQYIGRNDFQVKIRGYRIELGEIENVLLSYAGIRQGVVLAKEQGSGIKYLVGYYVSDAAVDHEDLSLHLSGHLPDYMVPSVYVHLEELPLTLNGKLDRRSLPEPTFTGVTEYIAPRTVLEKQLSELYGEVLGLEPSSISIHDDFFRLGGDSIISIQLVSRLRKRLDFYITVKDIFTYRSVEKLSAFIERNLKNKMRVVRSEQGVLQGVVPLLPIQEWFFEQVKDGVFPDFNHWNQSFLINVPELDLEVLKQSLVVLIEKHDVLRMSYPNIDGRYVQHYGGLFVPPISLLDCSGITETKLIDIFTDWQSGFDISEGPLLHIGYITGYEDGRARIFFAFHHLIIDVVSWRIITEDLKTIYQSFEKGLSEELSADSKGSSYRQWSEAISGYKKESPVDRETEIAYWNDVVVESNNSNHFLSGLSVQNSYYGHVVLDVTYTEKLLRECHQVYHTQINDILLSALSLALTDFTGSFSHTILLESHGREDIFDDLDITETVGWFTNMYPFGLHSSSSLLETLMITKQLLRAVPNNGIGYGSLMGYVDQALPHISFNYLGQLDQEDSDREGAWYISSESSGLSFGNDNRSTSIITINGAITEGELHFSILGYLPETQVEYFTELFKNRMIEIVDTLSSMEKNDPNLLDMETKNNEIEFDEGDYKAIVSLNSAKGKPNIFMIHPASAGCEVYQSLSDQLISDYHCYGLDSYNLYNEKKIDNLHQLATYYLNYIEKIQHESQQDEYILLGWSLGGQIALEIASELESRGHIKITVFLLDTIIRATDPELMKLISLPSDEDINEKHHVSINSDHFIEIKKILVSEYAIANQKISTNLKYTKTILLKAMIEEEYKNPLLAGYIHQLQCNNVDTLLEKQNLVTVYPLNVAHHYIMQEEQQIIDIIKRTLG